MEKTNNGKSQKAIAKKENVEITSVDSFIQQAIESKASVETLERLFTLHKEVKAEQAKQAFVEALTKFQASCPVIEKKKKVLNKDGRTVRYIYAPIDSVVEQIKKPLSKNNLSYRWEVERKESEKISHMKVSCKLTHILGHSENSDFEIPIIDSQFMSQPQSYATAQSYAKRYTLLNVLGIATADEDTDATDTGKDKGPKDIKSQIVFNLKALNQKTETKEEIIQAVKKLTQLDLVEKNYQEIKNRLEIKVIEANEA